MDLFSQTQQQNEPLAARMRPRNLDEYIGQDHIVGQGRLLRRAIQADQLSSLIFYGPPGTGKTTLARVIAGTTSSRFISINAVLSGVKQIREAIDNAQQTRDLHGRRSILFVDEVHRWNKAQQDALLPWVENGTIILIGATTENPYFEVNSALVSRSRIFQLKQLTADDLRNVALQAVSNKERGYGRWDVSFEEGALEHLIKTADGDARSILNSLQLAIETTPDSYPPPAGTAIHISMETAEESIQKKVVLYDKEGDYHYDTISAFIKSIRGSDPDAALYWMARMIRAGEDPRFILRRMIISAAEDIGMADPNALTIVNAAAQAFDRIGLPEGQFPLAQAALYLATAPKSNSALAFFDAIKVVDEEAAKEVPNHLRDASRDKHGFGHGDGYNYPHAYRDHWVAQAYLPEGLKGRIFYQPSAQGYEKQIQEDVMRRREAQMASMIEEPSEILTYSPGDKQRDAWMRRTTGRSGKFLEEMRNRMFSLMKAERHQRILVWKETGGLFLWEAWRKVPEGGVSAFFPEKKHMDLCSHFARTLPETERPVLLGGENSSALKILKELESENCLFESIICRNWLFRTEKKECEREWKYLKEMIPPGGTFLSCEPLPGSGSRLSTIFKEHCKTFSHLKEIMAAEEKVYTEWHPDLISTETTKERFRSLMTDSSEAEIKSEILTMKEKRIITEDILNQWLDPSREGNLGCRMSKHIHKDIILGFKAECINQLKNIHVTWESFYTLIRISF
ncbi:MAG: AAA family ATPase [Spirochaetaceae bacterium 4572_59]|nr:MAG: AAA family ATPase [Spirochaetaceae bacterium 4572_59]